MTRQPYDQFSKQYLSVLFQTSGKIEISREVSGEVRLIDFTFSPAPDKQDNLANLGLLGKMGARDSLFEPFRNQPNFSQIHSCLLKLLIVNSEWERKARRKKHYLTLADLPFLWILTPSASDNLLNTFGCKLKLEQWAQGIYFFPEGFNTGLVAINKLPDNPATLWLRILGKGTKQKQAIQQLLELPETDSLRNKVLQEIVNWRILVDDKQNVTDEEKEWMMSLSPAYVKWRQDTLQEGRQEGQRLVLENLLKVRFGQMDSALASIISPLLELPSEESARLLIELSREELLTRFQSDRI